MQELAPVAKLSPTLILATVLSISAVRNVSDSTSPRSEIDFYLQNF